MIMISAIVSITNIILFKCLPQCARLLHTKTNGPLLVIVRGYVLDIVNDIIKEVCLTNQSLWSSILEVCEVNMEVIVGWLVVEVHMELITTYTILTIDGLL